MIRLVFALVLMLPSLGFSQGKAKTNSLSPDALSAKILIEDILVRRYSQDLSTRLSTDLFSMSSQTDIKLLDIGEARAQEPISDLMLGVLDPDELTENIAGEKGAADLLSSFLSQYKIEKVEMAVGLHPNVAEEKRKEVTDWLAKRVKSELGSTSTSAVYFIENVAPTKKPPTTVQKKAPTPPKTLVEHLKDFQELAGQLALALALVLGALFLGFLSRSKKGKETTEASQSNDGIFQAKLLENEREKQRALSIERKENEEQELVKKRNGLVRQIIQVLPQASTHFESLVQKWCRDGESGRFRLVCFSEAVSRDLGKLPIPVDAVKDVKRIFGQMPQVKVKEKIEALEKVYWDLLTVINLGEEGLSEPFSYLGQTDMNRIQSVLMEKNSKMRTLVALYMPDKLREDYISSLDEETKGELLRTAAELQEVSAAEFKSIDDQIGFQLQEKSSSGDEFIKLDMTLQKVISGFPIDQQITNLRKIEPNKLRFYKQSTPSLAFLDEWPDREVGRLMSDANSDEIANFLRLLPDLTDQVLATCPPLTVQLVKDELKRPNELSDTDVNRLLENLLGKLVRLHELGEINLQKIFTSVPPELSSVA